MDLLIGRWRAAVVEHAQLVVFLLRWIALGSASGIAAGASSFVFLEGLERVTELRLEHTAGEPLRLAAVFLLSADGVPLVRRLAMARFDTGGEWVLRGSYPPSASGLTLELQSFSLTGQGRIEASNVLVAPLN